ncbi:hypothetical protein CC80DRAFT_542669 [Byssothecium circinans]|uniref:Uncharacterized protein n=1 Tax=Byssothecium circinans TaxID=147558 RepID=A0A6A5UBQ8_9PLEO|nr:hypothetical protein CC80DRAFT_542669 [Byssothecium circinans]
MDSNGMFAPHFPAAWYPTHATQYFAPSQYQWYYSTTTSTTPQPPTQYLSPPITPPTKSSFPSLPPPPSTPITSAPRTKLGVLNDIDLHRAYNDVGIRQEDKRCLNCLAERSYIHRVKWAACTERCPACQPEEQHQGQFCPKMRALRPRESFWKVRAGEGVEKEDEEVLEEETVGDRRESLNAKSKGPSSAEGTVSHFPVHAGGEKKEDASPSKPQCSSRGRVPPSPPTKPSATKLQSRPAPPHRTRSRSPSPKHSKSNYRTRDDPPSSLRVHDDRPQQNDRYRPLFSRSNVKTWKDTPSLSSLLKNPKAQGRIIEETTRIITTVPMHRRTEELLLELIRLSDELRQPTPRGAYGYVPSEHMRGYISYMWENFPGLMERGIFRTPSETRPSSYASSETQSGYHSDWESRGPPSRRDYDSSDCYYPSSSGSRTGEGRAERPSRQNTHDPSDRPRADPYPGQRAYSPPRRHTRDSSSRSHTNPPTRQRARTPPAPPQRRRQSDQSREERSQPYPSRKDGDKHGPRVPPVNSGGSPTGDSKKASSTGGVSSGFIRTHITEEEWADLLHGDV